MENKYQLCPKCQGQGTVSKPPYVPGDVHEWSSTTQTSFVCDVCQGAKIIAPPCESPAEQPVAYNELERHETRLALRLLLKVFKNDQISKEQEKFCSQAEAILKKYSKGKVIMRAKPSPWVPADTKPEHNVGVLVFIPGEDNHITSGMWDVENKWVLLDEYRTPEEEVTHWMPLPALPEGYKRDDKITDEWVRELKAIAKEELSKKDEQPVREVEVVEFAEWLDGMRNSRNDIWKNASIWGKEDAFKLAYQLFKEQKPTAKWSGEKEK